MFALSCIYLNSVSNSDTARTYRDCRCDKIDWDCRCRDGLLSVRTVKWRPCIRVATIVGFLIYNSIRVMGWILMFRGIELVRHVSDGWRNLTVVTR
jgi:hypothetical protein